MPAPPSWRETTPRATQDDLDGLLDAALPFAEHELREHGELYPYAFAVDLAGTVRGFAADPGEGERPDSGSVLALLVQGLRSKAGELRAAACVTDVRVDAGDAIRVELEHRDGTAIGVLVPYRITDGELAVGDAHAFAGIPLVWDQASHPLSGAAIEAAVDDADAAFQAGAHDRVITCAAPVLDEDLAVALLREAAPDVAVTLAYQGAVSKFTLGDPAGARAWLWRVVDLPEASGAVRRLLAQLELTEGNFDAVAGLLDTAPGAAPMDLAIAASAAGYQRDREQVVALGAAAALAGARDPNLHPWDLAGVHSLVGFALIEVGEASLALDAAMEIRRLTADAPPHVPLVAQGWVVEAGARRVSNDLDGARSALGQAWDLLHADTCDRGMAEREDARCARAAGDEAAAAAAYEAAIATFRAAGERWLATDAAHEADAARS